MLKPIIYPYKMSSKSSRVLAQSLGALRVYPNRAYRTRPNHLVINWGNSTPPSWNYIDMLNLPSSVATACNKLSSFQAFKEGEVASPPFTTNKEEAIQWVTEGHKIFCRTSLTSHSGRGIIIASTTEEIVDAPLYVQGVKKDKEYRVHVLQGRVIDAQQKKKRIGFEGGINGIRNHGNGWVYARNDVELPEAVATESIAAVDCLGLDFGAVDVCTSLDGQVYVFEVNTAPGLTGTTITKYKEAFQSCL